MTFQDFLLSLHPPSDRQASPVKWYFPLCFSAVIFASAFRSLRTRLLCTVPIAALFSRFHSSYAAEPKVDYPLSLWLMWMFLRYIDISLLGTNYKMWTVDTTHKISLEDDAPEGRGKRKEYLRDGTFVSRLKKSFSLWMTLRGVGWNWEIKYMKVHSGTRTSFLFSTLLKTVLAKIGLDIINFLRWRLPHSGPIPQIDLYKAPISHQLALSWLSPVHIFAELMYFHNLAALIFVGIRVHEPRDWPYLFGELSEAYTVGQAWSRTWHQTLRRVCTFLVAPLTDFLGVPERTSLHRNITLIIGFTISGTIHYSGTCNLPYSPTHERYFLFFFVQPLAIMFEDGAIAVGRRLGVQTSRYVKMLGYAWTIAWMTFSLRLFLIRTSLEDLYPVSDPEWVGRVGKWFT